MLHIGSFHLHQTKYNSHKIVPVVMLLRFAFEVLTSSFPLDFLSSLPISMPKLAQELCRNVGDERQEANDIEAEVLERDSIA